MPTKKEEKNLIKLQREFGARIRKTRQSLNLTQEQLAKLSHMHRVNIAQIESGEKNATIAVLKRLCDGMKVSLSKLFKGL